MKRILIALLMLTFSLMACNRNINNSTDELRTLQHDGLERTYLLHVPSSYDENKATSLVLLFHGGGGNAENQQRTSGFNELANKEGFIVAYPNGTGKFSDKILTWNGGICCGYASENQIDDVGFIRALVTELQTQYNIDSKRIYATGFSNGGIMSYRLACEASDLFAAIAPVSGTQNFEACKPSEPVSLIHFHGTDDTHLPYNGGIGDDSTTQVFYTSVEASVNFWLSQNECQLNPQTEAFSDIQHDIYLGCKQGISIELYTIIGGKHAWPGSNAPAWLGGDQATQTISATELIWKFFVTHPKP